mmetsp:Transcript_17570/g.38731  ORF Transcript_17570/g.38731 Transcript_17570/m.38731 type:complete len:264 (-) Transcript_17570:13-804(-)
MVSFAICLASSMMPSLRSAVEASCMVFARVSLSIVLRHAATSLRHSSGVFFLSSASSLSACFTSLSPVLVSLSLRSSVFSLRSAKAASWSFLAILSASSWSPFMRIVLAVSCNVLASSNLFAPPSSSTEISLVSSTRRLRMASDILFAKFAASFMASWAAFSSFESSFLGVSSFLTSSSNLTSTSVFFPSSDSFASSSLSFSFSASLAAASSGMRILSHLVPWEWPQDSKQVMQQKLPYSLLLCTTYWQVGEAHCILCRGTST